MNIYNAGINETVKSTVLPDEMNLWELPEKCPKCSFPMHIRSGGTIKFCPICHDKAEWAATGRAALERAKIRETELKKQTDFRLPTFEERYAMETKQREDELRGPFKFGMPL